MRVFFVAWGERWSWQPLFAISPWSTMPLGVVVALTQTDIKRLLAYSRSRTRASSCTAVVGASPSWRGPGEQLRRPRSCSTWSPTVSRRSAPSHRDDGARRRRRGAHIAGWSGWPARTPDRGAVRPVHAELRRHPPHRWLHRQVGGFSVGVARGLLVAGAGCWWLSSLVAAYVYLRAMIVAMSSEPVAASRSARERHGPGCRSKGRRDRFGLPRSVPRAAAGSGDLGEHVPSLRLC